MPGLQFEAIARAAPASSSSRTGASGARVTGKAAQVLAREGGKHALATMCIGGGQGIATVLERV